MEVDAAIQHEGAVTFDFHAGKKTEFDKNDGGYPFEFTLGERKVVAGWESAVPKLRVGDHATLTLAPEFGYGETGDSDDIPPNATLIFKVGAASVPSARHRRDPVSYTHLTLPTN